MFCTCRLWIVFVVILMAIALASFITGFGRELSYSFPKQKLPWNIEEVVFEGEGDKGRYILTCS